MLYRYLESKKKYRRVPVKFDLKNGYHHFDIFELQVFWFFLVIKGEISFFCLHSFNITNTNFIFNSVVKPLLEH